MSIDTDNEKISLLSFCDITRPNLYFPIGVLAQAEQQTLLWEYPGILLNQTEEEFISGIGGFIANIGTLMDR